METPRLTLIRVHTQQCTGGCPGDAVVWQGDCGCFVLKCLVCGELGWTYCGVEGDEHEEAFNEAAEAHT